MVSQKPFHPFNIATGISKEARYQSWNVQIHVDLMRIAGVYQHRDLLCITDITHELELCLVFDKPDGPTP